MKKIIIILFFILIPAAILLARDNDEPRGLVMPDIPPDSVLDLNSLRADTLQIRDDFGTIASYGWFPKPIGHFWGIVLNVNSYGVYGTKHSIFSQAFAPTKYPFMTFQQIDDDERKIKKTFSNDDESEFPSTSTTIYGMGVCSNLWSPVIFRLNAGYLSSETCFYSSDNTREFLRDDGTKRRFNEVNVYDIHQKGINLNGGIEIPLWGAFIKQDINIASYYYFYCDYNVNFILSQKASQYIQNANVKDELKYRSGTDTVRLFFEQEPRYVNTTQSSVELGLGWNLQIQDFGFKIEIYYQHPLTPFFTDADSRLYHIGGRFNLNIVSILQAIF